MDEEQIPIGSHSDIYKDDFTKNAVRRALNIEEKDYKKYQHNIERLIQWAEMKGAKDYTDVVWSIKELAGRVGSPSLGNNMAQHLSQFAYLEMERLKIDEQIKGMEASSEQKTDTAHI